MESLYPEVFTALADTKKGLLDEEIVALMQERHPSHESRRGLTMNLNVLVSSEESDGIKTEVTREAVRVLRHVADKWRHHLRITEGLLGGIAIHKTGSPFPDETARLAEDADATLMGAVGLPEFDDCPPERRPEKGLLGIRKALGVFANLRPVRAFSGYLLSSPPEECAGRRHRHDYRPRVDRWHLLRHAARDYRSRRRNARSQYHDLYARGNRESVSRGLSPGERPPSESNFRG